MTVEYGHIGEGQHSTCPRVLWVDSLCWQNLGLQNRSAPIVTESARQ